MSDAAGLRAFVEELVAAGVREAVVCPGSRSTPLALALRTAPGLRVRVLYDERAAGLLRARDGPDVAPAGGAARDLGDGGRRVRAGGRRGAAVAGAARGPDLGPAGGAPGPRGAADDRPGAPLRAGGEVVHGAAAARRGRGDPGALALGRRSRGGGGGGGPRGPGPGQRPVPRAAAARRAAAGRRGATAPGAAPRPFADVVAGRRTLDEDALDALAGRLARRRAGPDHGRPGRRSRGFPRPSPRWPRPRASRSSPTRSRDSAPVRTTGPWSWHGQTSSCGPAPGSTPTRRTWCSARARCPRPSRCVELLERTRPELLVLDGDAGWREAAILPATFVHADAAATAEALAARLRLVRARADPAWTADWLAAERAATTAMDAWLGRGSTSPSRAPRGRCWPRRCPTAPCSGPRAPCRSATSDAWLPSTDRAITVRSNRGANGIDGVVSTALGSAAVADGPVALVVGDIAFLHDLNALVAARLHGLSATIVLVNNDGGGIFSFLPQAQPACRRARDRSPGALRGAVRDAARHRRRADRDGTRRGAPTRRERRSWTPRSATPSAGRASRCWSCGRSGHGTSSCTGTWRRRSSPGHSPGWCHVSGMVIDGLRWEVRARGAGRPLLLLHGFTGRGTSWGAHAAAFAGTLPGHHRGPPGPRPVGHARTPGA